MFNEESIAGYDMMGWPLSVAMILFYITTVRGFLLILLYFVFTPISWIANPVNDFIARMNVENVSSVRYAKVSQYYNERGKFELKHCFKYQNFLKFLL
jgi:hypothetical protein